MNGYTADSFSQIYTSLYKRSFYFTKSYVHDDLVAEDITSESLIKLWERLKESPVAQEAVLPLLLTILKHKSLDYLKHREVELRSCSELEAWRMQELSIRLSTLEACNPDEIFSKEVTHIIRQTLSSLPEQTRHIFMLSRFENRSNKEIAETVGLSVKSVEYHIGKALKVLRVSLKDYLLLFYLLFYY